MSALKTQDEMTFALSRYDCLSIVAESLPVDRTARGRSAEIISLGREQVKYFQDYAQDLAALELIADADPCSCC